MAPYDSELPLQEPAPPRNEKLPVAIHILCGWPLFLVAIGGMIGGGLGGAAYGINISIFKSQLPLAAKVGLVLAIGLAAVGIWLSIAMAVRR